MGVEKRGHRWEMSQRSMHEFGHVRVGVNEGVDGRGWEPSWREMIFAYESDIGT